MTGVLGIGLASLAYCDQHGGPAMTVELILEGWQHRPRLCTACLTSLLAAAIAAESRAAGPL